MSKFIKVANKKIMVKVDIDNVGAVWATCTPAVKDFAGKAFKEGDVVKVTYELKTDAEVKYHVTRIEKGTGTDTKTGGGTPDTEKSNAGKPTCKDCGKELKDAKYEKCWDCNKKNPSKSAGKGSYGKTPEVQESIKRQAIGHMTSRTMIALQGHVDPNNLPDIVRSVYKLYQELVG